MVPGDDEGIIVYVADTDREYLTQYKVFNFPRFLGDMFVSERIKFLYVEEQDLTYFYGDGGDTCLNKQIMNNQHQILFGRVIFTKGQYEYL